jgi:RNA polymerase sigma factor (sigma-70 family)
MILPMEDDDFRLLMRRVAEGSEEAALEVVRKYGPAVRRAVRRAMDRRLRRMFDSVDFAQNAWGSFFRKRSRVERFETPHDLVQFLVCMARNKVIDEVRRRLGTVKFNFDKEIVTDHDELDEMVATLGRFPSAIDAATAGDELERLLGDLPPDEQEMVRLRLLGLTHKEIGNAVQKPESTVRDFFAKLFRKKRCA